MIVRLLRPLDSLLETYGYGDQLGAYRRRGHLRRGKDGRPHYVSGHNFTRRNTTSSQPRRSGTAGPKPEVNNRQSS